MRIISGKFKGKYIDFIKSSTTRPLKDSVKENIFNILLHSNLFNIEIEKSKVLDLYSGVGSFGLECISRGVKSLTFVENDKNAIKILRKNLLSLSVNNSVEIVEDAILDFLHKNNKQFNIIFFDPPFADNSFTEEIKFIYKKQFYKKKHLIIIHRQSNSEDDLESFLNILTVKKYGRSKIIFGKFST